MAKGWSRSIPAFWIMAALGVLPLAAGEQSAADSGAAAAALSRYEESQASGAGPWRVETVDIDASLPKLSKSGRLHAIRRLLPMGKPEYQVLELAGDQVVRQQVIVRYLTQDVAAAATPSSAVAITSANYKLRYKGPVTAGSGAAFAFALIPRKKGVGLIKGELWLDAATGLPVKQSGRFVKSPSFFVKHVDVTREMTLVDGAPGMRTTYLSVDTRVVGRAELTIVERPFTALSAGADPAAAER